MKMSSVFVLKQGKIDGESNGKSNMGVSELNKKNWTYWRICQMLDQRKSDQILIILIIFFLTGLI